MKTIPLLLSILLLLTIWQCKKGEAPVPDVPDPVPEPLVLIPTVKSLPLGFYITDESASFKAEVTSDGGAPVTARGFCWSSTNNLPTVTDSKSIDGTGLGIFSGNLTDLQASTNYYMRAYATNSAGTNYGERGMFATKNYSGSDPVAYFYTSSITVTIGQIVNFNDYSTKKPISWLWNFGDGTTSNEKSPAHIYSSSGIFKVSLKVTNNSGSNSTIKSVNVSQFTNSGIIFNPTLNYGSLTDNDGNTYKTIQIGNQTWMAENLKTTKYRNGDLIANVINQTNWSKLTTGAYCFYNNKIDTIKAIYGALYNWYAVADSRNIAPIGWHVASDAEWTTLMSYLEGKPINFGEGENKAGEKFRETGSSHWATWIFVNATNSCGFTALPCGSRYSGSDFEFNDIGLTCNWWTSTTFDDPTAWNINSIYYNWGVFRSSANKRYGFSVRCVKD